MSTPFNFANLFGGLGGGSTPFGFDPLTAGFLFPGGFGGSSTKDQIFKMCFPAFLSYVSREELNAGGEGLCGKGGLGDYCYDVKDRIDAGKDLPSMREMTKECAPFIDALYATYLPFFETLWNEKGLMCLFEPYLLDTLAKDDPRLADFLREMEPSYRKSFRLMRAYYPKLPTFLTTGLSPSLVWKPHARYVGSIVLSLYVFLRNDCGNDQKGMKTMFDRLNRLLKIFISTATCLYEPFSHILYATESIIDSCNEVKNEGESKRKTLDFEKVFSPSNFSLIDFMISSLYKNKSDTLYLVIPNIKKSKSRLASCEICFPPFGKKFTIVGDPDVPKIEKVPVSLSEMLRKRDEMIRVEPPLEAFPPEPFSPQPTPRKPLAPFTFGDVQPNLMAQPKDTQQPKEAPPFKSSIPPMRRQETTPPLTFGQSVDRLLGIVKGGLNELRTEFSTTFSERPPSPPAPF